MSAGTAEVAHLGVPFDGHAHVFRTSLKMVNGRRYTPDRDALPEDHWRLLATQDLGGALMVQPSFLGTDNRFLLETLARARAIDRGPLLFGVAVLDPAVSSERLRELDTAGIVGARLNCFARPVPELETPEWTSLLTRIDALGWHVELHIEGPRLAPVLESLCGTNQKVVVDHFGLPDGTLPPALLRPPHEGVFVKCSAPYRVFPDLPVQAAAERCADYAQELCRALGPERLIWGSDWPWTQHARGQTFAETFNWRTLWVDGEDVTSSYLPSLLGRAD